MKSLIIVALLITTSLAYSKDDGRYADSPLRNWFDSLQSKKGMCCSFVDGRTVADPDWGTDEHGYWVIVDGEKLAISPDALLTVPNKFGQAVVWPYKDAEGNLQIRCFLPGAGT